MPVRMSKERFEELVGEALDEVPPELLDLMDNVVILVVDNAPPEDPPSLVYTIDNAAPRPQTPAYTDLSLGIQRALHPIGSTVDPDDPTDGYDKLRDYVDQAVKREGLL